MSESESSQVSGSNDKFMPLQKDGESDQQVAAETDVSAGKVEVQNLEEENLKEDTAGGDGEAGDGSGNYPLPSEQKQMERDREGESNE